MPRFKLPVGRSSQMIMRSRLVLPHASPVKRLGGNALGGKRLFEMASNDSVIEFPATREDIHGGVVVFRPGVNGDMRLGDHHYSTHAIGAEVVKHGFNNRAVSGANRCHQRHFDFASAEQARAIAVVVFNEGVSTEWRHDQTLGKEWLRRWSKVSAVRTPRM